MSLSACDFSSTAKCGSRNGYLSFVNVGAEVAKAQKDLDGSLCSRGTAAQIVLLIDARKFTWICTDGKQSTVECSAPVYHNYEKPREN